MADFVLAPGPFPAGTTVGVYLRSQIMSVTGPIGPSVASGATAADWTTTFTGLTPAMDYWAAAEVPGAWRWVAFTTEPDAVPDLATQDELDDVEDAALATQAALDAALVLIDGLQDQVDGLGGAVDGWTQVTTLGSGYDDYNDVPGGSVSFYVDRQRVFLRGLLHCNTSGSSTLLTIPEAARPEVGVTVTFSLATYSNDTLAGTVDKRWNVTVLSNGTFLLLGHPSFVAGPNFGMPPIDTVFCMDDVSYRID